MPKIAFLFPGQGSQSIGMVRGLAAYPGAIQLFQKASEDLEFDLFDLGLNGPEEILAQDLYAQIAVHVTNCAYAEEISRIHPPPRLAAGFSLGIFSALVAAGSLSFEQGLKGVRIAAEKMSAEGRFYRGAMAVIIGLSEGEVGEICREVTRVFVASVNSSQQVVVSGEEEAVERALHLGVQRGALLAKRLPIGWAIHTPLMERASRAFAQEIKEWQVRPPRFPVLGYLRAEYLRTPEEIKQEVSAQFSQPNNWHKVLLRMAEEGIDTFIEIGPGNVLSQMVRWVSRSALTFSAEEILQRGIP
jgi:[acyl-carrier-protein] S-malonyltransferase